MIQLSGTYTALVTPFTHNKVDYNALEKLLEKQINSGIAGVIPVGSTGESPTLDHKEHIEVIRFTCEKVNNRIQVIAGTGSNATDEAIELSIEAKKVGAMATLQVTPYYNRPSQEGIFRHMAVIAEKSELPILLYNIPGRSAASLEYPTVERMFKNIPICGIKEAAGSVERVSKLKQLMPELAVLSGDDSLTLPMMSVGASGVVSVASNVMPAEVVQMVNFMLKDDLTSARKIHQKLYDLFNHLFIETNPVPVKAALADMKQIEEKYRLPLCEMSSTNREILRDTLRNLKLIE